MTPPSNAVARVGDANVHFLCVTGNSVPRASVYWEKNGQRFTGGEASTLLIPSTNWTSSTLLVRNIQFADAGAYRCVAVNPLLPAELKRSTEASLTVLRKYVNYMLILIIFLLSQEGTMQPNLSGWVWVQGGKGGSRGWNG